MIVHVVLFSPNRISPPATAPRSSARLNQQRRISRRSNASKSGSA